MPDREAELSNDVAAADERAGDPDAGELTGSTTSDTGGPDSTVQSAAQESMTDTEATGDAHGDDQARNPA